MSGLVKGPYDPAVTEDIFCVNERDVRGNPCKLKGKDSKIAPRKNFFTIAEVNDWNSLPEDVLTSESINVFKSRLDNHWEEFKYNVDFLNGNGHN